MFFVVVKFVSSFVHIQLFRLQFSSHCVGRQFRVDLTCGESCIIGL